MKILADPYDQLPAIVFWLLGSLSAIRKGEVWAAAPLVLLGLVPLVLLRWRINVLSLGDEEAKALGVEAGRLRLVVIAAATLMTASVVAISGVIGWVGLVIPHIARMLVGPSFDRLLPTAMLLGASYLLLVDTLARTMARIEVPIGILTAIIGAPFFLWLLARGREGLVMSATASCWPRMGWASATAARRSAAMSTSRCGAGEVLCLLGPNGSGKTTLFKTMLGLLPAQARRGAPRRRAARRSLRAQRDRAARRLRAAGACRTFPVPRRRHGGDGPHGAPGAVRRPDARGPRRGARRRSTHSASANWPRPSTRASAAASASSRSIARALAQDAPAIVMDEPTASLDFGNQVVVLQRVSGSPRRASPWCSPRTIPTTPSAWHRAWRCSTTAD